MRELVGPDKTVLHIRSAKHSDNNM
uniref:Uncharacterized protein n=1 Tax=Anguilla anguilla TaxID=7936 RepID=A0A0E9WWI0_ANGAN